MIVLALRQFSLSFGQKTVLRSIDMDLEHTGVYILMGPCGSGKSSLLKSLVGHFKNNPLARIGGQAYYRGYALQPGNYPLLLEQKADRMRLSVRENIILDLPERHQLKLEQQNQLIHRLLDHYRLDEFQSKLDQPVLSCPIGQRKMIALLNLAARNPSLICIDEPTNHLDESDSLPLLDLIRRIAVEKAVLCILHNQKQARYLGGTGFLLAGGLIQETARTVDLLTQPRSQAGIEFKQSGTCAVPSPDSDPTHLDPHYVQRYQPVPKRLSTDTERIPFGPAGFQWIIPKKLGACPRPGLMADTLFDLKALAKVGIDTLVCLEENIPFRSDDLKQVSIELIHFPIPDMQVPDLPKAQSLLKNLHLRLQSGQRIALHCKGGLGRTGTVLAAYLIQQQGQTAQQAIQSIRNKNPRMIQTEEQEQFLYQLQKSQQQEEKTCH